MKFHEISLHEISLGDFCTSILGSRASTPHVVERDCFGAGVVPVHRCACGRGTGRCDVTGVAARFLLQVRWREET